MSSAGETDKAPRRTSLRSKGFQSSYSAKVGAGARTRAETLAMQGIVAREKKTSGIRGTILTVDDKKIAFSDG